MIADAVSLSTHARARHRPLDFSFAPVQFCEDESAVRRQPAESWSWYGSGSRRKVPLQKP